MASSRTHRKRKRMITKRENIFESIHRSSGALPFATFEKCKAARSAIYHFIECNGGYRHVVHMIIKDAVKYHDKHHLDVARYHRTRMMDAYYPNCVSANVLAIAAGCCYKFQLQDHELMTELLMKLNYCEGNLDRFMTFLDHLVFPFEVDAILYPFNVFTNLGSITKKHLEVFEFFLKYGSGVTLNIQFTEYDIRTTSPTTNMCMSYDCSIPLVDVPVSSCRGSSPLLLACHSISSDAVLLLLRYGADPIRPAQKHHILGLQIHHPLYVIATELNKLLVWRTHSSPENRRATLFRQKKMFQEEELKKIICYFARVLPKMPFSIPNHISENGRLYPDAESFALSEYYQDLIPEERLQTAAELSHLCRCTIREELNKARKLPDGIYKLPLPKWLQEYLDLQYD